MGSAQKSTDIKITNLQILAEQAEAYRQVFNHIRLHTALDGRPAQEPLTLELHPGLYTEIYEIEEPATLPLVV
jgi:hypothetical protein